MLNKLCDAFSLEKRRFFKVGNRLGDYEISIIENIANPPVRINPWLFKGKTSET